MFQIVFVIFVVMGGRRRGVNRTRISMSTEKQPQYQERIHNRQQRQLLCGRQNRQYPRPSQSYEPLVQLFGMQPLSKLYFSVNYENQVYILLTRIYIQFKVT